MSTWPWSTPANTTSGSGQGTTLDKIRNRRKVFARSGKRTTSDEKGDGDASTTSGSGNGTTSDEKGNGKAGTTSGSGDGTTSDENGNETANGEAEEKNGSSPANDNKDDKAGFSKTKLFAVVLFVGAAVGVALVATGYVQLPWV